MKKILILNLILGAFFLYSCKLDNYSVPDMTLDGSVVDKVTGENIQTRQPDGIKIRLVEQGYSNPQPYDFWTKSDGSFRNTRLFAGKYKVIAMEGAFEMSGVDTPDISNAPSIAITLYLPAKRRVFLKLPSDLVQKS